MAHRREVTTLLLEPASAAGAAAACPKVALWNSLQSMPMTCLQLSSAAKTRQSSVYGKYNWARQTVRRAACLLHAVLAWCVLQDLMMPEVDGLDILRYVRSNTQLEDLPVISKQQLLPPTIKLLLVNRISGLFRQLCLLMFIKSEASCCRCG